LVPEDIVMQAKDGPWFLMRIRPYRTLENVIEGAVITFVDVTEIERARVVGLAGRFAFVKAPAAGEEPS
jgi:two-component system, chemotaxis family, CheB/CheR fusion protein